MKNRNLHWLFAIPGGLCLVGIFALWALQQRDIYLWLDGITTHQMSFWMTCVLIVLIPLWLLAFFWHRISSKVARVFLCVALVLLVVPAVWVQSFSYAWNISGKEYRVYTSEDGAYQVVGMDADYFHSVYGDVYQITSVVTMRKIGGFLGEIGSEYRVCWKGDRVAVECDGRTEYFYLLED